MQQHAVMVGYCWLWLAGMAKQNTATDNPVDLVACYRNQMGKWRRLYVIYQIFLNLTTTIRNSFKSVFQNF